MACAGTTRQGSHFAAWKAPESKQGRELSEKGWQATRGNNKNLLAAMSERWRHTDQEMRLLMIGCGVPANAVTIVLHVRNVAIATAYVTPSPTHKKFRFFLGGLKSA
jgi:hypothetical protein